MAMTKTTIGWKPEQKSFVQHCAVIEGVTFSEFVRSAALKKAEGIIDAQRNNDASTDDYDGPLFSLDEVEEMIAAEAFAEVERSEMYGTV